MRTIAIIAITAVLLLGCQPEQVQESSGTPIVLGCNSNHWQPAEAQAKMHSIRLYVPVGWIWQQGFYGQPFYQAQKQFLGLDDYLGYMKAQGVDVVLCLMPNPAKLSEFPAICRAVAIRYGATVHPAGSYAIDPALPRWNGDKQQEYKSALNLVKYIECGNELDSWWNADYMPAAEHAELLTACYDAIKSADPGMGVVMAGLTNHDLPYLKAMALQFALNGRGFLSDAINVHHYSNAGNMPGVHPPTWHINQAVSPEADKDFATVAQIAEWAKERGLPVWATEYGYDTNPGSQTYPIQQPGKTAEQVQAEWLPRVAMEYVRHGATRSYLFTIADEPNPNSGTFTSSGFLRGEPQGYAPKLSYLTVSYQCEMMKGAQYEKDLSTPEMRVLRFARDNWKVYAYWLPTSVGAEFQGMVAGHTVTATEAVQYLIVDKPSRARRGAM